MCVLLRAIGQAQVLDEGAREGLEKEAAEWDVDQRHHHYSSRPSTNTISVTAEHNGHYSSCITTGISTKEDKRDGLRQKQQRGTLDDTTTVHLATINT